MSFGKVLIAVCFLVLVSLALEAIHRKFRIDSKITRKVAHVASGFVAVYFFYFLSFWEYALLVAFFVVFFLIAYRFRFFHSIHLTERATYGEIFYPVGVLAVIFLSYDNKFVAISAIAVMTISDTVAELVGTILAKKTKSYAGSVGFLLSAIVLVFGVGLVFKVDYSAINIIKMLSVCCAATITEAFSYYGSDNLTVPVAVVLFLTWLF